MPCTIPLDRLLALIDPVECPPWSCTPPLTRAGVLEAVRCDQFLPSPVPTERYEDPVAHAQRIAWLMAHGWDEPIEIDIGVPILGYEPHWPLLDGNHRLYAAALRGDADILATVGGQLDYAAEILGVPEEQLVEADDETLNEVARC